MEYVTAVISLLAGLGTFLIGFKILSENIEKLATSKLKQLFGKASKNKLVGVGVGAATTAIIQSSSVTTVMVVGFVNAGVMTLYQATTVIMGANIGTTITAQIVSLQSFDFVSFAIILTFIGSFMNLLAKNDRLKTIGYVFAGLGLVFLGMKFMSDSMKTFRDNDAFKHAFSVIHNPFLLLMIGLLITALLQSSAAVTTILISMVGAGIVVGNGGNSVLYIILGTNIGTCVTALFSSIGASTNAKRASIIHILFNVFGALLFMIVLLIWKDFMQDTFAKWFHHPENQIAMFHTFFNIACTLIFLPFTGAFVKLSQWIVKDKKKEQEPKSVYLDQRLLHNPSVALQQVRKEMVHMCDIAMDALGVALQGFLIKSTENENKVFESTNEVNNDCKQTITYLVKLSTTNLSYKDESTVSSLHDTLGDIIRIAEISDNVVKYTHKSIEEDLHFSDQVKEALQEMYHQIQAMYQLIVPIILNNDGNTLSQVRECENRIDEMRKEMIADHIKRLNEGLCQPQSSGVFINLVSNLERIGDHLNYMTQIVDTQMNRLNV